MSDLMQAFLGGVFAGMVIAWSWMDCPLPSWLLRWGDKKDKQNMEEK
jgi:hypothetical protein